MVLSSWLRATVRVHLVHLIKLYEEKVDDKELRKTAHSLNNNGKPVEGSRGEASSGLSA